MLTVTHEFSNDGIRALANQLKAFERFTTRQMVGKIPDESGDAALAYVVSRTFRAKLEEQIARLNKKLNAPVAPQRQTIRDIRRKTARMGHAVRSEG